VLVIVLVTLVITAFALTAFLDKASSDLIVAARDADSRRLRLEAYSALEVTLDVLSCFNQTVGSLHSPSEGWGDPLTFADYTPTEGRTVDVTFEDESGKISLPTVTAANLLAMFEYWGLTQTDAQRLTDALEGWVKANYTQTGTYTPDYDQSTIPYAPPSRSLRSFDELKAIDVAKDFFYDENGRPNDYWRRFVSDFSLLSYRQPNINSAPPDVLAALGNYADTQSQVLNDYINGTGAYQAQGPSYFRIPGNAATILGQGTLNGFAAVISALRIHIAVHDGRAVYRLSAVVTLPGTAAATTIESSATNSPSGTSATRNTATGGNNARAAGTAQTATPRAALSNNSSNNSATATTAGAISFTSPPKLNYPFTVLEIRENDGPVTDTPPPAATTPTE
jgi:general secretion pathway protein K